jgi:hypothetical protein
LLASTREVLVLPASLQIYSYRGGVAQVVRATVS